MRLLIAIVFVPLLLAPRVSSGQTPLPDLEPELYGLEFDADQTVGTGDVAEGCAGATTGRLLLRFGVRFHNVGDAALVIGDPGCPDCLTNPGALCADPRFICSPADGHNHPHFLGFASYELLDFQGNLLKLGGKHSFCVRDNTCDNGQTPSFSCTDQGISPGCFDDYAPFQSNGQPLGCQYIDVTDISAATTRALRVRATLDPDAQLPDADRSNNVAEVVIPGCGDGIVQPGEECDPAATPPNPCCDADCHLAPPGSPCNTPVGPCGRVDEPFPDGTTCGPGAPPCLDQVCRAGLCVSGMESGGCLIGATCLLPGAVDPVNGCQLCDPSRAANTWSPDVAPDPVGLRCQLDRMRASLPTIVCTAAGVRRLATPLERVARLLERRMALSGGAATRRLDRRLGVRLARLASAPARVEKRFGCATEAFSEEVQVLVGQFQSFARATR